MYCCTDCKKEFEYVEIVFETHGLDTPPYERLRRCPFCHSVNIEECESRHCKFCGSRLKDNTDYCSARCKKAGEIYYAAQQKRKREFLNSPVADAVREVEEYNKTHGTKYSYGQYFAKKESDKL